MWPLHVFGAYNQVTELADVTTEKEVEYIWVGHHRENVNCYRLAYITSRWLAVVVSDDKPMAAGS